MLFIQASDTFPLLCFYNIYKGGEMGSVVKKRRKRMAKKKHKKLLKKTRIQRRNKK